MRAIVSRFVRYPFYGKMIIAIFLLAGGISLASMEKSFFPQTQSRTIWVTMVYPGASPKEVEEGITSRIEEAIRGIVGIKEINSSSSEGYSRVTITTTGKFDLDETLSEVKNAVDGIPTFPTGAEKAVVAKRRSTTQAIYLSVMGDVELLTLKRYADEIYDDLLASKIVSQVRLFGFPRLELSVEVGEEQLRRYGLSFDEISRAIANNNIDISGGIIKNQQEEILIRSRMRSVDPQWIGKIILRANPDGSYLRISDVAQIRFQFEDVPQSSFVNGSPAVTVFVEKLNSEDLKKISQFCNAYTRDFNAEHEDVRLEITYDFVDLLQSRLNLLYKNGLFGLSLVVLSLALFLSFRLALWVAWGIPASFLGMFILANLVGVTINMISLFGMILIIGVLVDDGIVIGENIYTHFEAGKSPKRAAIDGSMEVIPAVMTSVTTTIIAFCPLLLLSGQMEFLYEMAFVVIVCLGFSLFESFFVLPSHVGNHVVLNRGDGNTFSHRVRKRIDRGIFYLRDKIYARILVWVVRWRWFVLFIPVALVMITSGLVGGGFIQMTFFPNVAFDWFTVNVAFKPGVNKEITISHLKDFERAVWEVNKELMDKYQDSVSFVEYTILNTGSAFNGQENGAHAGTLSAFLRDLEGAPVNSFQISTFVKDKIGVVTQAQKLTVGGTNPWGAPISISLLGRDFEQLTLANEYLKEELGKMTSLFNITDNNPLGSREVRLNLKPKAYFLGLDLRSITAQVRQGFFGGQSQRLQEGRDEIKVWVRYPRYDRVNIGQLENMRVKVMGGEYPLSELVDYEIQRGPVSIQRYNGVREIRVDAELLDPNEPVPPILEEVSTNIIPEIEKRFPAVDVEYQGQQKESREEFEEIINYFSLAFLVILFVVMIHFRSFTLGVIVLLMVPLGWLGAVWGHGLEGRPVSMLSIWGMVALSGVIINDAVIFLSKYNSYLLEGLTVESAVKAAGKARFRAIILTTVTTSLGLYPLILERSVQAQFLIPMAIALAYGVLIGTLFILLFFPVIIVVLNDLKRKSKELWTGKKVKAEEVESVVKESKVSLD